MTSSFTPTSLAPKNARDSIACVSSGSVAGKRIFARWPTTSPQSIVVAKDYLGGFAVTAGLGAEELSMRFKRSWMTSSIIASAVADRCAEAFAEYLHQQVRQQWQYGKEENLSNEDMIAEKYRGIRPAAGYPACPDHTEKRTLFDLLEAEKNTGINLTESYAMSPGASVSGLYFSHPDAKYFTVDRMTKDQIESYAARKGWPISEVERWLSPNLAYDPS